MVILILLTSGGLIFFADLAAESGKYAFLLVGCMQRAIPDGIQSLSAPRHVQPFLNSPVTGE